ncbi:uncharacterized protein LODBEIA_P35120 [Lodderomyces beijingensis]|uniref:VLRF1 domain-containing protein n=1 Tax=Lodderomyces beijingensis TaxID=1775926 RepID=A0ABP0ZNN2_9ASCO
MDTRYIYYLANEFLDSLELLHFDLKTSQVSQPQDNNSAIGDSKPSLKDKTYYKSDLHRYNLKRVQHNLPEVGEEEFERLLESQSADSTSTSESESESDSETEDDHDDNHDSRKVRRLISKLTFVEDESTAVSHLHTKSPYVLFGTSFVPETKAVAVYKSVFTEKELESPLSGLRQLSQHQTGKSAIFMIGGGHFAGAIIGHEQLDIKGRASSKDAPQIQKINVLSSKTFHRYTTRRKQGGSQSVSDNSGSKAISAGSSIRRYNELALMQEVRELISEWAEQLNECSSVFIRANGPSNKKVLVGYDGAPLSFSDPRVKKIPFSTSRASLAEVKRAWVELTHYKVVELPQPETVDSRTDTQDSNATPEAAKKTSAAAAAAVDATASELVNALKKQKAPLFMKLVKEKSIEVDAFLLSEIDPNTPTLLHYAAANGFPYMIQILLMNLKASPLVPNKAGRVPAELCDLSTKRAFQIARSKLGEDYCDWNAAKVGAARSKEDFDSEDRRKEQEIKLEKQKLIQEQLEKEGTKGKTDETTHARSVSSNLNVKSLSADQRARLMREQRARAAEARLKNTA